MVLGTHTAENEQNTLMVVKVRLPNEDAEIDARKYDDQQGGEFRSNSRAPSLLICVFPQSLEATEAWLVKSKQSLK